MLYALITVLGLGLAAGGAACLAFRASESFLAQAPVSRFFEEIGQRGSGLAREDKIVLIGGIAGLATAGTLAWGTGYLSLALMIGLGAGTGGVKAFLKFRERRDADEKRKEIALFFDAVELYIRAGMSVQHALDSAKLLAPRLRQAVNKALVYWPSGPARALEVLRKEIALPEGDILVSLLSQISQAGIENLQGVISREAQRLEQMREAAERARVALKPLYLVLYRTLPLVAVLGMVAGALFMRTMSILKETGLF
ncbi:MAG: hypothetical protein QHH75_10355 [Bacillota bacterium]|nr:hypothetical protein [Bacillota bacterium]